MLPGKPPVLKTFDYLGIHRYFLTFCTHQRHRLLIAHDRVDLVMSQIRRAAAEQRFALIAYCAMPDHLHLLIQGEDEASDGLRFIARSKQYSGFYFQRSTGERLWQRYGFERTLRDHDETLSVARYIIENPVRARLVKSVVDYPFSGSDTHSIATIVEAIQLSSGWKARSG